MTLDLNSTFRKRWEKAAKMGVSNIQQVETIRTFNIGHDIYFCVADLRVERSQSGFVSKKSQKQLLAWINNLTCPGVLVIPQPLIAAKGDEKDKNLSDWVQYDEVLQEIEKGDHDIVVLTGDVHYGRVSQVLVGDSDNKLTEIITSPLSNLSEMNGVAASTPDITVKKFPLVSVNDMTKNTIDHIATVSTESHWWDLRYPVERTHEHFMTVQFKRVNGKVKMNVDAWHAREKVNKTGLPRKIKGFKVPTIELN